MVTGDLAQTVYVQSVYRAIFVAAKQGFSQSTEVGAQSDRSR